jgi:hypothetical protein
MESDLATSFWMINKDFFTILATGIAASGLMIGIAEIFAPLIRRFS